MRRKAIYNMLYLLTACFLFAACQEEELGGQDLAAGYLTLELQTAATTRVPVVGEDRFNENTVTSADVFFFADGGSGNCIYAKTGVVPDGSVLQVELNRNTVVEGSYYIYVVANSALGVTETNAESYSLDELKDIVITTHWKTGENTNDVTETSLVMDGNTTVTVNSAGASGHVKLTRAMAKVMLYTSTEAKLEVNGMTYTPESSRMFVTLYNSVTKTNLGDDYAVQPEDYITGGIHRNYDPENYEEIPASEITGNEDDKGEYNRYEQVTPFYSYPNPEETTDREDAYLMLCVPWTVRQDGGDGSYQAVNYYYRVPITGNADPALLERNQYYRINVHIGVLGSINPEDAVEVKANFEIYDWFEVGIDADMQQYQYLVLDEYESVMNNEDELEMPYISSSPIDWSANEEGETNDGYYTVIESVSYWDYHQNTSYFVELTANQPWDNRGYYNEETAPVHFSDFILEPGTNKTLRIKHVLNDAKDIVPYTITVSVYNTQGVKANAWTITQYPARYIVGEKNDEGYVAGHYEGWNWIDAKANRFINGYYVNNDTPKDDGDWRGDNKDDLGSVSSLSGTNENPNLYTIHITAFDNETYALGDPREEKITEFGTRLDATEYRAASQLAENIIAPAYKVASSWGKTLSRNYDKTLKRCASYQEAGYPAGRWRIPTKAEVEYIITLSEQGKIPRLFGEVGATTDYWVSSGKYNTSSGYRAGTDGTAYVRCVYDVWYWGEQTIEEDDEHNTPSGWGEPLTNYDFVWGDAVNGSLREGVTHN